MEFLDVPLFDDDLFKLLVRFSIDVGFLTLIIAFAIWPNYRKREFAFTAVLLNVVVFFICFTMKKLELDLGLALGLFAVFGVLRYRTETLTAKQMTYLFVVIGLAVINSLSNKKTSYAELAFVNVVILAVAIFKERFVQHHLCVGERDLKTDGSSEQGGGRRKAKPNGRKQQKTVVEYDRLEWLGDQHRESLVSDLIGRTGLNVARVEIKTVDLVQNKAILTVWTPVTTETTN